jgi:hypothetical protein
MTSAITTPRRFNRTEKLQPKGSRINIHHDVMGRHFVYTFFAHYFEISKVTVEFNTKGYNIGICGFSRSI